MDHSEIRLLPMTDEMYRSYAREYENDPDLYLPGQIYTHYVYSEERVEQYLKRQKDLKRILLAITCGEEIVGEIVIKNIKEGESATMGLTLKNAKYKDQGIGTEAERLAVRFVFDDESVISFDRYIDNKLVNLKSIKYFSDYVPKCMRDMPAEAINIGE